MGGGGPMPEVPHYSKYSNYNHLPNVHRYEAKLEKLGLKDPWIRNHTWKLERGQPFVEGAWAAMKNSLLKGFWPGLGIAAAIIICEEAYRYNKKGHTSWNPPQH